MTIRSVQSTCRDAVYISAGDGAPVRVSWGDLIAAAEQLDDDLRSAYSALLVDAMRVEAERISRLPVRVLGSAEQDETNVWWVASVEAVVDGYSLPLGSTPARRAADEGGTLPSRRLAQMELAERMARAQRLQGVRPSSHWSDDDLVGAVASHLGLLDHMGRLRVSVAS
jgi:hypothetical protein